MIDQVENPFTYRLILERNKVVSYIVQTLLTIKGHKYKLKKGIGEVYPIHIFIFPGEYPIEYYITDISIAKNGSLKFKGKENCVDRASARKASFDTDELSTELLCEIADIIYNSKLSKK